MGLKEMEDGPELDRTADHFSAVGWPYGAADPTLQAVRAPA
jgi:hypothetical protein